MEIHAHGAPGHDEHELGGHNTPHNRRVALGISLLALLLSFSELFGTNAQTEMLKKNIESSDLWAFYQAKTVRRTIAETAADQLDSISQGTNDPAQKQRFAKSIAALRDTAARMESEPQTNDGRKELAARAKQTEHDRERLEHRHHRFEVASAAFQIAIVVTSASVITGAVALLWASGALGFFGLIVMLAALAT